MPEILRVRRYWLVHIYDVSGLDKDCFRVFTDISLLLRSLQKFVKKEPLSHPTWHKPHKIWSICEEPLKFTDVTNLLEREAYDAVFSDKIMCTEEPSAMPIFEAGDPV